MVCKRLWALGGNDDRHSLTLCILGWAHVIIAFLSTALGEVLYFY